MADWWRLFDPDNREETLVILTRLRAEADQFNTACQQLRDDAEAHHGRPGRGALVTPLRSSPLGR